MCSLLPAQSSTRSQVHPSTHLRSQVRQCTAAASTLEYSLAPFEIGLDRQSVIHVAHGPSDAHVYLLTWNTAATSS